MNLLGKREEGKKPLKNLKTRKRGRGKAILTGGRLSIFRSEYKFLSDGKNGRPREITVKVPYASARDHLADWLECMRSRKTPSAHVEAGHYSSMACHIGNMAYKQKACVQWRKEWDV